MIRTLTCVAAISAVVTGALGQGPKVQVTKPVRGDVEHRISLPATLAPWQEVLLQPRISGQVESVFVDLGDRVRAGQVLLRLDNPELQADLIAAEAELAESSATLAQAGAEEVVAKAELASSQLALQLGTRQTERLQGLQRSQSVTTKEIEEAQKYLISAQAGIEAAKAKVVMAGARMKVAEAKRQSAFAKIERARALLSFLEVRAPFDGFIVKRMVDPGALVSPSATPLLQVQDGRRLRVVIDLAEADAVFGLPGKPVRVSSPALGSSSVETSISRTAKALSPGTKTLRVEADIENTTASLSPGMFVYSAIQLDVHANTLTLPANAVVSRGGKSNVLVVADGKVKQVAVKTGYDDAIRTEIVDGLTGSEDVIVSSRDGLSDGVKVEVAAAAPQKPEVARAK
ncbi:MAG: efflux RND transporter periplasmic adaptor subunit [Candidatus Sumerlaeaceae bacterium]